jgi:hypothetical protein
MHQPEAIMARRVLQLLLRALAVSGAARQAGVFHSFAARADVVRTNLNIAPPIENPPIVSNQSIAFSNSTRKSTLRAREKTFLLGSALPWHYFFGAA